MRRYLHVYLTDSGQCAGMILEEVAAIGCHKYPMGVINAAQRGFKNLSDLPTSVGMHQLLSTQLSIPKGFHQFCESQGLTAHAVLSAFMSDLAGLDDSNGSDERCLASEWFDRVVWPVTGQDDEDDDVAPMYPG